MTEGNEGGREGGRERGEREEGKEGGWEEGGRGDEREEREERRRDLLLDDGDKWEDEEDIFLVEQQLPEDEDLCHQCLPPTGGEGVEQIAASQHAGQGQAALLPV